MIWVYIFNINMNNIDIKHGKLIKDETTKINEAELDEMMNEDNVDN